jgi:hypothetical protein
MKTTLSAIWDVNVDGQIVVCFDESRHLRVDPIVLPRHGSAIIARVVLMNQARDMPGPIWRFLRALQNVEAWALQYCDKPAAQCLVEIDKTLMWAQRYLAELPRETEQVAPADADKTKGP